MACNLRSPDSLPPNLAESGLPTFCKRYATIMIRTDKAAVLKSNGSLEGLPDPVSSQNRAVKFNHATTFDHLTLLLVPKFFDIED